MLASTLNKTLTHRIHSRKTLAVSCGHFPMKPLKWWQYFLPGPRKFGRVAMWLPIAASRLFSFSLPQLFWGTCCWIIYPWHPFYSNHTSFNHWLTTSPAPSTLSAFLVTSTSFRQCIQHPGSSVLDQLSPVLHSSQPPSTLLEPRAC